MSLHTDPTYLRTIHDGLLSGAVHKDNASALPQGLVGMYEEALPPASNVRERKSFLRFFAVCALLKKDVSVGFVVPLLYGWAENEVVEYIAQYSKWFNSPTGGTYVLYHERLRAFVLQKISHGQFKACNEAIINQCRVSLEAKAGEEWERYALEHLSAHLLIQAMESKDATALKVLAYDTAHWNRQVEISKGFEWSKRMLNDMMLWASKYDDDEVIECALNKVDLHHQEQNDAPRIVELVAQNDMETALQRIEAFGGNDKEGLQRKFILYMLCLMELTLLDSKDKPFCKEAIEKLLKHLDDNLPVDHSVLNWNDFFPSYVMFLMACDWDVLGLDYSIVYKYTDDWEKDWLTEKGPYSDSDVGVLLSFALRISDDSVRGSTFKDISRELSKQGNLNEASLAMQEAFTCARGISDDYLKSIALKDISAELANQGKLDEALTCANGISDESLRIDQLTVISSFLAKQNKLEEASSVLQDAFTLAQGMSDYNFDSAMHKISAELARQEKLDEAQSSTRRISNEWVRSSALKDISTELAKQGRVDEALNSASGISDELERSSALKGISTELAKLGKVEEALTSARGISNESDKSSTLMDISTELAKQDKVEEASSALQEALNYARGISDGSDKCNTLKDISTELAKQGNVEEAASALQEALNYARVISHDYLKSIALQDIATEMAKQGMVGEALTCAISISDVDVKNIALKDISTELAKQGMVDEALNCAMDISDDYSKFSTLKDISTELAKQGKIDEALICVRDISDDYCRDSSAKDISTELAKQGRLSESAIVIQEALIISNGIISDFWKNITLKEISIEYVKQGKADEALTCARCIRDESNKISALEAIGTELSKQGKVDEALNCARCISDEAIRINQLTVISSFLAKQDKVEEASSVLQDAFTLAQGMSDYNFDSAMHKISAELAGQGKVEEALSFARGISDEWVNSCALKDISTELARQGMAQEALTCARDISDDESVKSCTLKDISAELFRQGKIMEAAFVIHEAFACAMNIGDDFWKSNVLKDISTELARQGMAQEALTCARGISSDRTKSSALAAISTELAKQGKVEEAASATQEALTCARGINDNYLKSSVLKDITSELAKQGNWALAETTGLEIPQHSERHSCWTTIAENTYKESGWKHSLNQVHQFQSDEARLFYLKGWSEAVNEYAVDATCVQEALSQLAHDSESIETLLQKHAVHEVFFGNAGHGKIDRLNRTLNIQWAIDIKNSISAN